MKKCLTCQGSVNLEASFCPYCGSNNFASLEIEAGQNINLKSAKKISQKGLIAIIVAAVVLVVGVVVAAIIIPKLNSPVVKLFDGIVEVLSSGDTYDVEGVIIDGDEEISVNGSLALNSKEKKALVEAVLSGEDDDKISGEGYIFVEEDKVAAYLKNEAYDEEVGIIDDIFYNSLDYPYEEKEIKKYVIETADYVFQLLELLKNGENLDVDALESLSKDISKDVFDIDSDDSDVAIETVRKVLDIVGPDLKKALTDVKWCEENLGYETKTEDGEKVHVYEFTLDEPAKALIKILEKNEDKLNEIDEIEDNFGCDASDLIEEMNDEVEYLEDIKIEIEATFDGKSIASLKFDVGEDGYTYVEGDLKFTKSKEALEIDVDAFDKKYKDLEAKIEEDENYYY